MTHNRLANEPSPYLVQHKDNPVHWYPWGDEPFEEAKRTGKPVLLSIGYAACHWCHVMAHESFEDQNTADVMNELFVNIKLDREERPDIDKIYMEALHHLGEQGGWPLTMFLTGDRQPFWGGTYFPKQAQYGRPSFREVLKQISSIYRTAPEKVKTNSEALHEALQRQPRTSPNASEDLTPDHVDQVALQIHTIVDPVRGGLQGAPKFPQVPIFSLLWRHYLRSGDKNSKNLTLVMLTNICQGGIYDHLRGGFSRYSVDERWLAPHFEKMLYDNAQLIDLLTIAWLKTGDPLFRVRIDETIAWALAEMIAEHDAFAASLDADSEGEEGKYYVWNMDELNSTLGDQAGQFCEVYDASPGGNWEGKIILNRLQEMDLLGADLEEKLAAARQMLLDVRSERIPPLRDDKILTDWNGLFIASLANAGLVFSNNSWIGHARSAYDGVKGALYADGKFSQSHRNGQTRHPATADGYANMIRAALCLLEATQDPVYLQDAEEWTGCLSELFWNQDQGGYYFTGTHAADLIRRTFTASDDATPNANATMVANLSRLYALTGKQKYRDLGHQTIAAFTPQVLASGIAHAGFINAFEDFANLVQIVLVGDPAKPRYDEFKSALLRQPILNRLFMAIPPGAQLPEDHPAASKSDVTELTAFICKGQVCSLPLTDPEKVGEAFSGLGV